MIVDVSPKFLTIFLDLSAIKSGRPGSQIWLLWISWQGRIQGQRGREAGRTLLVWDSPRPQVSLFSTTDFLPDKVYKCYWSLRRERPVFWYLERRRVEDCKKLAWDHILYSWVHRDKQARRRGGSWVAWGRGSFLTSQWRRYISKTSHWGFREISPRDRVRHLTLQGEILTDLQSFWLPRIGRHGSRNNLPWPSGCHHKNLPSHLLPS